MRLNLLVDNPSKLKTYGKFVSIEEAYEKLVAGSKDPRLVNVVATDPNWAYKYASSIIKDRWPEAEPVIAKDPSWAYFYAFNVIKGR